jgi:hypothetical protein
VTTTWLVAVPTTLFLSVYLTAMVAAVVVLRGSVRTAAIPAALAVTGMLAYCGWLLAIPAVVAVAVSLTSACGHALERDGHVPTQHVLARRGRRARLYRHDERRVGGWTCSRDIGSEPGQGASL